MHGASCPVEQQSYKKKAMIDKGLFEASGDTSIYYEVEGSGSLPLVFLHGFGTDSTVWTDFRRMIPKQQVSAYFIDLKGFGRSSKPLNSNYSLGEHAGIVRRFLKHHNLGHCILVGHSYGGGIALLATLHERMEGSIASTIQKLIIIDGLCFRLDFPLYANLMKTPVVGAALWGLVPPRLKARFILESVFYDQTKITDELIDRHSCVYAREGVRHVTEQALNQIIPPDYEDLVKRYGDIDASTLVIWGRQDRLIPLSHGLRLNKSLKESQLSIIEHCGHAPHEEKPKTTFDLIRAFLSL